MKEYQKYINEMAKPFKVDEFDIEDVKIIASDLGIEVDEETAIQIMQSVYQKLGRYGEGYDDAIADELKKIQAPVDES